MCRFREWILTLGIMAVTPAIALPAPFWPFGSGSKQSQASNQQVAERIANVLRLAQLDGYDIQIEYKEGIATLTGSVATPQEKGIATKEVSRVKGVKEIHNRLKIVPNAQRRPTVQQASTQEPFWSNETQNAPAGNLDNQQIAELIAQALGRAGLEGENVEVKVEDGAAVLNGTVFHPQQKLLATQVASQAPGIDAVENQMQITDRAGRPGFPNASREPVQPAGFQAPPIAMGPQGPMGHPGMMGGPMGHPGMMGGPMGPQGGVPAMPVSNQGGPGGFNPAMLAGQAGPAAPGGYGHPGAGNSQAIFNNPNMPNHAWPTYAQYPNYAQVTYPQQYSASAWPYIGPFYPYPQIPLGWRRSQLEWDDGHWALRFDPKTDRWWWFLNPKNW